MEILTPSVEHSQKADRCAQTLRIGRDRQQRFRCRAEQGAVDLACILKRQSAHLLRQRKYYVEVGNRQQFGFPFGKPLGASHGLALGTVSVAARIICDDAMSARIALLHKLHMAAESGGAAVADRCERLSLMRTEN